MGSIVSTATTDSAAIEPWRKDPVRRRLRSIVIRQRLFNVLTVLIAATGAILGWLVIEMCLDRVWEFSQSLRQVLLIAAIWGVSALVAVTGFLLLFRRIHPLFHARAIDRSLGYEDDALVTYVEMRHSSTLNPREVEIALALKSQALERVNFIDADQVIDTRLLTRCLWGAGVAFGLMALLFLGWGRTFSDSFYRCVAPWRNIEPPRSTTITSVSPGNGLAVAGEPVTFSLVARSSYLPSDATLVYQIKGEPHTNEERLPKTASETFEKTLPGFVRPLTYWVRCNDTQKGPFELKLVERPMVNGVSVRVLPPAYAPSGPVREISGGHVQAILGSRLQIQASVSQPPRKQAVINNVENAWLQMGPSRVAMTPSEDKLLTATVELQRNFEYKIGYFDSNNLSSRDGILYQVKALPDQPPVAQLRRQPGTENAPAGVNDTINLLASASDDLGIFRLSVRAIVIKNAGKSVTIDRSPPRLEPSVDTLVPLNLRALALKDGDIVECVLIAEDSRTPANQKTESAPLRIPIVAGADPLEPFVPPAETLPPAPEKREPEIAERRLLRHEEPKAPDPSLDKLSEQQKDLLRELERLSNEKPGAASREKLAELANLQEKLADELIALAEKQEQTAAEEKSNASENGGNKDAGQPGDKAAPQNGGKDAGAADQGKNPGQENGQGKEQGKDQAAGQGKDSGQGKEPGQGQSKGQGPGQQAPGNGQGPDSNSQGQGKTPGEGQGQAQQGQGQGQGQQGQGQGQQGNGQGQGQQAQGQGQGQSGKSGSGSPGSGGGGATPGTGKNGEMKASGEKNAAARQALADAAKEMRDGTANDETVKKVQAAFDHLFGAGRAFNSKDLEKLSQLNKDDPRHSSGDDQSKGPEGRARSELSKGTSAKNSVSKEGELKQDELGRTTEKGRAKIAPEYQKALQDYYTRVSQ